MKIDRRRNKREYEREGRTGGRVEERKQGEEGRKGKRGEDEEREEEKKGKGEVKCRRTKKKRRG